MSKQALDALGLAITNAGYTWTPEMRSAYEKGIRESEWVGLTDEERFKIARDTRPYVADTMRAHEEELKRRNT